MVDLKFCGLARPEDAAAAAAHGARYVGVVFAPSVRRVDEPRALEVLAAAGDGARRVGVFGAADAAAIAATARRVGLDVVQLHADPGPNEITAVRRGFHGEVWAAVRVAGDVMPEGWEDVARMADAIVLDARPAPGGQLGGTGEAFAWEAVGRLLDPVRQGGRCRLVAAGGLRVANVEAAIRALAPDVVDVSSGVESAPGVKDHEAMREFAAAARRAGARSGALGGR